MHACLPKHHEESASTTPGTFARLSPLAALTRLVASLFTLPLAPATVLAYYSLRTPTPRTTSC